MLTAEATVAVNDLCEKLAEGDIVDGGVIENRIYKAGEFSVAVASRDVRLGRVPLGDRHSSLLWPRLDRVVVVTQRDH